MDKFEDLGKRLDDELTRIRKYVEEEVAPATEKRTAQVLREAAEKLSEAARKIEARVAGQGFSGFRRNETVNPARLRLSAAYLLAAQLLFGCASRHPVVNRQPAPSAPAATPEESAESAKRETSVPPSPPPRAKSSKTPPTPAPVGYTEEGNASWYGNPFNGRHSSNGEIYDMYKLTAAHRTLPFETMVRVTNLNNGKSTTVRITDRGPFVANRIIDLSLAAAREIESIGPGVVPVRLEVLGNVDVTAGLLHRAGRRVQGSAPTPIAFATVSTSATLPSSFSSMILPTVPFYRVRVGKISGEAGGAGIRRKTPQQRRLHTLRRSPR